jgi:alpha-D-xyloside xylohydrolase
MRKLLHFMAVSFLFMNIFWDGWGQSYQRTEYGIKANVTGLDVEISFYSQDIIRVTRSIPGVHYEADSFSVVTTPRKVGLKVSQKDDDLTLASDSLSLTLDLATGRISFSTIGGKPLLQEKDYGAQLTPVKYSDYSTYLVRQAFRLDKDEAIYGLGQHQTGKMIQRNQALNLRQRNTEICIPFFQSVKGYAVFWDNTSPTTFTDNQNETAFDSQCGECSDYYFLYGSRPTDVTRRMRELTGHAPMNPLWTFGYWQSRNRYQIQDELVGVVRKYRELGIPIDCIVQDFQYWGDYDHWNSTEFDPRRYPDPKNMVEDLHDMNAHFSVSIWPSFGKKTEIWEGLNSEKLLLGFETWPPEANVFDPFSRKANDIYWEYINKNLFSLGIDNWWMDATEPEFSDKDNKMDIPCGKGLYRKYYNAFPIATVGSVYDHQKAFSKDKRVSILTRCAFAGQQRYGAESWSGDIQSTWESFRTQIPAGLNYSVCGLPYWKTDIGGFITVHSYPKGTADPGFRELYVRWLQFGCFSTWMRSHSDTAPREIYQFGDRGDWAFDAIEKYIKLRYKLLPYLYATSWGVSKYDDSFIRPLFMDYVNDEKVYDIADEYIFGNSFLVAPVTHPMFAGEDGTFDLGRPNTSNVYLPAGNDWFDFWTGERLPGGQTVAKSAPIDIIPLYIKAGSIIPFGPEVQYATEKKWDNLEIRVYPGQDGEFLLYEDENDNYNYEKGMYSTILFSWDDKTRTLTIGDREGSFPGMLGNRKFRIFLVEDGHGAGDKLSAKADKTITYNGRERKIRL